MYSSLSILIYAGCISLLFQLLFSKSTLKSSKIMLTCYRRWSETEDMLLKVVWDWGHATGDVQRIDMYYRSWSETGTVLQEMIRVIRYKRWTVTEVLLKEIIRVWRICSKKWAESRDMLQERDKDCSPATGDDQRLGMRNMRWRLRDILSELVRDWRHSTGSD